MSSASMAAVVTTGNTELDTVEEDRPSGVVVRSAEARPGVHANGYRWGPGSWYGIPHAPPQPAIAVPGQSITLSGFELLDARGSFVSWHECPVDACEAMKRLEGSCKIVRCRDRALIKSRIVRTVKR